MAVRGHSTSASRGPSNSTGSGRPVLRSARASVRQGWVRGRSTSTTSSKFPYASLSLSLTHTHILPLMRVEKAVTADRDSHR